jgi:hypothetical protein
MVKRLNMPRRSHMTTMEATTKPRSRAFIAIEPVILSKSLNKAGMVVRFYMAASTEADSLFQSLLVVSKV